MWTLLLTTALAAPRPAHTLELGAGLLPACRAEDGAAPCKTVLSSRLHADHRLPRGLLLVWGLYAERRGWQAPDLGEVQATWRLDASLGLGWHKSWDWGDMRIYGGVGVEHALMERSAFGEGGPNADVGLDWLDPAQTDDRASRWTGVGGIFGNDLDWPIGPVRLGFRYRIRLDTDVHTVGSPEATRGMDWWELHALSLAAPLGAPVSAYLEVGWTNQFTVPFRDPDFRVAPWLMLGLQANWGKPVSP
jgi:hypothetical protein